MHLGVHHAGILFKPTLIQTPVSIGVALNSNFLVGIQGVVVV
jgi:hypothetical protein